MSDYQLYQPSCYNSKKVGLFLVPHLTYEAGNAIDTGRLASINRLDGVNVPQSSDFVCVGTQVVSEAGRMPVTINFAVVLVRSLTVYWKVPYPGFLIIPQWKASVVGMAHSTSSLIRPIYYVQSLGEKTSSCRHDRCCLPQINSKYPHAPPYSTY
jgi:hypothetical protein